jgi:molybdenum cofactor synthesis domain-containing protein
MLKIAVITVSDRAFKGEYQDLSGPTIVDMITEKKKDADVRLTIVPDDRALIKQAIEDNIGKNYIITTGGSGIGPRDYTADITKEICQKELPGIAELLRRESYKETKFAVFSRGFAGLRDKTIIINFPGSVKAVTLCTNLILPLLDHGLEMIQGKGHPHAGSPSSSIIID